MNKVDDEFTLDEVITMATDYANEQFIEVLNDYNKELDFFDKYDIIIKARELNKG